MIYRSYWSITIDRMIYRSYWLITIDWMIYLSIILIDRMILSILSIDHDRFGWSIDPIDRSRSIRMIYWSYRSITIDSDDLLILSIDHDRFGWSIDPIDWSIDRMIYHDRSDDLSRLIKWSIDPNDLSWSIE
jgi:hypothetical protein